MSFVTSYKEETLWGAKGEELKTPVDARRLMEGTYAPQHNSMALFFVCISLTADGPQRARLPIPPTATLQSCLWSRRISPSLLGSRLTSFFRDASSALLQLN